jgi:hypothetical protein
MPDSELKVDCDTFCSVGHEALRCWDIYMMGHVFMLDLISFIAVEVVSMSFWFRCEEWAYVD